jgi:acetoin utilization deacetylase AcuC-like enzyme
MCDGRIMGFGGGGYNRTNLAQAWCAALDEFLRASDV